MLLVIVGILLIFTIISYSIFDRDFLSPPTVVSMALLFSSLCALYNEEKWAIDYSSTTVGVISAGVAAFIIGGIIGVVLSNISRGQKVFFSHKRFEITLIEVDVIKTGTVVIFQLVVLAMLFREISRITGGGSYYEMVAKYRLLTGRLQDLNDESLSFPWLLRQFLEMNFAFSLIYVYILGNNFAVKNKLNIRNCIPVILCSIITFMQGYRSDMLRLWVALLVVSYTLRKRSSGWKSSQATRKMIRIMALSVIGIAILFVALRATVGRAETDWEPVYYLTHYAGSPIAALDLFLKEPSVPSEIWGKECFYNLNLIISKWFNKPELKYIFYKEFRQSPSGMIIGNVYTALRPPYYDFGGIGGMVLYMIIFGAFFTLFYCKVREKHGKSEVDFLLLVYSYLAYTFFLYFYNLYNNFISFGFVKFIVELLIARWFIINFNCKIACC